MRGEHVWHVRPLKSSWGPSPRARGAPEGRRGARRRPGTIPACAGSTEGPRQGSTRRWDHPRVRGEHYSSTTATPDIKGPSPRARGALVDHHRCRREPGTIPACAGSTGRRSSSRPRPGDHPRVRGEHECVHDGTPLRQGPSPRARGAHAHDQAGLAAGGTIPACAGSTHACRLRPAFAGDHPRVRGEHRSTPTSISTSSGPSPRARGALRIHRRRRQSPGTIPACAGSTSTTWRAYARNWDHPRVRGEHAASSVAASTRSGPSPRARGALPDPPGRPVPAGTIPACAGSTRWSPTCRSCARDHPRVRGEHVRVSHAASRNGGPSPRARGALAAVGPAERRRGTIPACAGSTRARPPSTWRGWDHPRVRGEHSAWADRQITAAGPSPRARGAQVRVVGQRGGVGTIPACAGSTACGATRPPRPGDHPRVRGEHRPGEVVIDAEPGPSPRARGAPPGGMDRQDRPGTIPACAGSTPFQGALQGGERDHPRVRGEHRAAELGQDGVAGPSPRARGALRGRPAARPGRGTIPACAGSTSWCMRRRARTRDHPRVRGEHRRPGAGQPAEKGPSPRARGAPRRACGRPSRRGTIPACAGSTGSWGSIVMIERDHPRVRGEHRTGLARNSREAGPSPRARGAPDLAPKFRDAGGTIPACAGSTQRLIRRPAHPGDHPRVRGEHATPEERRRLDLGPSPRARGARTVGGGSDAGSWTIPACAGSTLADLGRYRR